MSQLGQQVSAVVVRWYLSLLADAARRPAKRVGDHLELRSPVFHRRTIVGHAVVTAAGALCVAVYSLVAGWSAERTIAISTLALMTMIFAWYARSLREQFVRLNRSGVQIVRSAGRIMILPWSTIESLEFAWGRYRLRLRSGRRVKLPEPIEGVGSLIEACRANGIPTPWRTA